MRFLTPILAAAALVAASASSANADTLITPAPRAVNLAVGGGYMTWFVPQEDTGWMLVVRAPDGTVSQPRIPGFSGPARVTIGSGTNADPRDPLSRPLLAVYGRDDGDLYAYDLKAGRELRLGGLSTKGAREYAPSVDHGWYVFARSGGRRPGLYYAVPGRAARRISRIVPTATSFNGTRVAFTTRRAVKVQRVSGQGRPLVFRASATPLSPVLTRYRVGWLQRGGQVFQTPRFAGSGGPFDVDAADRANRTLPSSTQSIALDGGNVGLYLDAEGVKRAVPPLFH